MGAGIRSVRKQQQSWKTKRAAQTTLLIETWSTQTILMPRRRGHSTNTLLQHPHCMTHAFGCSMHIWLTNRWHKLTWRHQTYRRRYERVSGWRTDHRAGLGRRYTSDREARNWLRHSRLRTAGPGFTKDMSLRSADAELEHAQTEMGSVLRNDSPCMSTSNESTVQTYQSYVTNVPRSHPHLRQLQQLLRHSLRLLHPCLSAKVT